MPLSPRVIHGRTAKMGQQSASSFLNGFFVPERTGDIKARLFGVADNDTRAAVNNEPRGLGLYEYGHFELVAGMQDSLGESIRDQALVVIGENQRIDGLERSHEKAK